MCPHIIKCLSPGCLVEVVQKALTEGNLEVRRARRKKGKKKISCALQEPHARRPAVNAPNLLEMQMVTHAEERHHELWPWSSDSTNEIRKTVSPGWLLWNSNSHSCRENSQFLSLSCEN